MRASDPRFLICLLLGLWTGCDGDTADSPEDGGREDSGDRPSRPDAGPRDAGERDASPSERDAAPPDPDGGEPDSGPLDEPDASTDAGEPGPVTIGPLTLTSDPASQELDLFGAPGHRFWIEVDEEQLERMNQESVGGMFGGGFFGDDIYVPGGAASFADHVVVQDVETGSVADYGKMEVRLVGESTGRGWTPSTIPNVRIDTDEFEMDMRIGGFEHIRLNNSLVGSIFREHLAHRIFRELGYPALRSSYAFLGSNVWGPDVWVPMTLIEVYKFRFCDDNAELLGGACVNMWEFFGPIGQGGGGGGGPIFEFRPFPFPGGGGAVPPGWCQVSDCDNTRLEELMEVLDSTPEGPGFKAALDPYISWDHFHRYQCLNWILWVGDDPLHNDNNNLIVEREDGKLIWAPYSVDISAGQEWYQYVPLTSMNHPIAWKCQREPECWAGTIAACEQLIMQFDALDPESMVDETVDLLTDLDMMREGDEQRAAALRQWHVTRQATLADELERYRYLPDFTGSCPDGYEICEDEGCGTPEQCAERTCSLAQRWCDSREMCVDLEDPCPECTVEAPVWCPLNRTCLATFDECAAMCEDQEGQVYCPYFQRCTAIESCPIFGDGGVAGRGGLEPPFPGPGPIPID